MEFIFVIALWVGCGILSAVIAQNKGHSSCSGFVGGCLFGLFGVIYWLAARDKSRDEYDQQLYRHQYDQWRRQEEERQRQSEKRDDRG